MKRAVVLLVFAGFVGIAAYAPRLSAQEPVRHYLILAKSQGQGSTNIAASVKGAGGTVTGTVESLGIVLADSSNKAFVSTVKKDARVQGVAEDVEVPWISPDLQVVEAIDGPTQQGMNTEPLTGYQWPNLLIGSDLAAAAGHLGQGVRVAVLDSGIYPTHLDIAPILNTGLSRSFVPSEPEVRPYKAGFNHGTHVAGIIAAPINNRGTQGVAPGAEIVAVKVLNSVTGSGAFSWIIQGIDYASGPDVQAHIINMSLGTTFDRINAGGDGAGLLLAALNRAITMATARGTFVVVAAGNEAVNLNSRLASIPAQSGNGMAVSAIGPCEWDEFDSPASYTNYGQSVVSVAAPGGDYRCDDGYPFDMVIAPGAVSGSIHQYFFAAGTSMAAPHVSGVAALIIGKY